MRTSYVDNPAWVGQALADTLKTLESTVPPQWLPLPDSVRRGRKGAIVSTVKEYGCGMYGCVIPTLDPNVVMKLTTDDTEAEFAAELAGDLVAPICVKYHMVLQTKLSHNKQTIYMLWRDSASEVGRVRQVLGEEAAVIINRQHSAAQIAYLAVSHHADNANRMLTLWAESCEAMARQIQVPELRALGDGLVEVWGQQNILFGDIHEGNIGLVDGHWVITDPGNIAVVDRAAFKSTPRSNPGGDAEREIAAVINKAARKVASGPGRAQAYISDVWAQMKRDGNDSGRSYDEFKCTLIVLNQQSLIVLVPGKDKRTAIAKSSALSIGGFTAHMVEVEGTAQTAKTSTTTVAPAKPRVTTLSDEEFAQTVNEIASDMPAENRHGDRKIFVSDIWDIASADPVFEQMGITKFKKRLFEAHRHQLLTLHRADYVSAMDPRKVRDSEVVVDGATFHFVEDRKFAPPVKVGRISDADLAAAVQEAVRTMPHGGRFAGSHKVFVSEIWKVVSRDPQIRSMGVDGFKRWLIKANRDSLIQLARADLVGAMDRNQVQESEIEDRGSTFHFVLDEDKIDQLYHHSKPAPHQGGGDFQQAFEEAFDKFDAVTRINYVQIYDLRNALPQFSRAQFDAGLNDLRRRKIFSMDGHEGRHSRLTQERLDAGIKEMGHNLIWVARRR